jgi:hypothetical protein
MSTQRISTTELVRVVRAYRDALGEYRAALNRLNVYPVPDGDTGTNMALTLEAVLAEVDEAETSATAAGPVPPGQGDGRARLDMKTLARCLSHGSLMGARGNSGVILSQILRGMASAFSDAPPCPDADGPGSDGPEPRVGPADLVEALSRSSDSAYAAVSNPVEGTILTVARAAARGAEEALGARKPEDEAGGADVTTVLEAARDAAARALAGTTEQLPALKAAGVVDAGGAGLLLLFDSFLHVVDGREVPPPPAPAVAQSAPWAEAPGNGRGDEASVGADGVASAAEVLVAGAAAEAGASADLRYEVMFFLEAPDEAVPAFRSVWAGCGGSIVIVGGDGLYNCHIHTDDIGTAIEAAIEIGRPRQIRVTDLLEQVEEERWVREATASGQQGEPPAEPVTCAVVAVCAGEGVKRIFRSLGARQIVAGGQSANPSTAEILDAIALAAAEQVVVLPNNPNVVPVAEQAADHSPKKVRVVPTAGIPEGFAALLAYDPEADVDTNADNMATAADRVIAGEVAQASRDAQTDAGPVKEGDWLGVSRRGIKVVAPAPATAADAAVALLDLLVSDAGEHDIVTVIEGEGSHAADTRRIVEWLSENRPGVTAEVHHGGQPLYAYVFSIE